jgi:hypothetical protein
MIFAFCKCHYPLLWSWWPLHTVRSSLSFFFFTMIMHYVHVWSLVIRQLWNSCIRRAANNAYTDYVLSKPRHIRFQYIASNCCHVHDVFSQLTFRLKPASNLDCSYWWTQFFLWLWNCTQLWLIAAHFSVCETEKSCFQAHAIFSAVLV